MAAFTYSKLPPGSDMTRMLRLFPHKDSNAQIRGELIEYELSDTDGRKHLYEALSYVWYEGEESNHREPWSIILNDCIFPVTRNLYAALLHLRNHQFERMLWVDALCINQSDNDEKQRQIPFMRTIYAQANCVIVWLGEARDNSDEAFEKIRFLAGDSIRHQSSSGEVMTDDSTAQSTTIVDHACSKLLQRNWFRRIWVLQEVGVARCISIMCGHTEMNGYTFCEGFRRLEFSSSILSHIHPVIHIMRDAIFRPKYRPAWRGALSIGELIGMYRNHNATVQHDKVYALLGLCADDPKVHALKPNYSLNWGDLLKQVTTYILGGDCSVQTWPDRDTAVVKCKGWILGYINHVGGRAPGDGRANFNIEFDRAASSVNYHLHGIRYWTLRDSGKLIQEGDVLFLRPGTPSPCIIRLHKDHFEIVMTAITPQNTDKASFNLQIQEWHSIDGFLHDILLTWKIPRDGTDDYIGLQSPIELMNAAPEFQECPYQAKARLHNMASAVKKVAHIILQRNLEVTLSRPIFEHMLVQCAENFPFCEDVVKAAAGSGGETSLELLFQYGGESLPITEDVVKAAAGTGGYRCLQFLIRQQGESLPITEEVVKAAAPFERGLELLIQHRGESLPITEEVVKEATRIGGYKCLQLLLQHRGESLPITEEVVKAAARSKRGLELLIQHRGESLPITEKVVKAAARSKGGLELLIQYRGKNLPITEKVVKKAVKIGGYKCLQLLIQHQGESLPITEEVVKAAAGNAEYRCLELLIQLQGKSLPITEEVVKAAVGARDYRCLKLLIQHRGKSLPITEEVFKAAGNAEYRRLDLLIQNLGKSLPITEEMLKAAATNTSRHAYDIVYLLLQYRAKSLPITENVLKAAAANNSPFGGIITRELIKHRGESLPITEAVVEAAAKNETPKALQALLEYGKNSPPISDNFIKAVAEHCTPQNLRLLIQYQQKNIPIDEEGKE